MTTDTQCAVYQTALQVRFRGLDFRDGALIRGSYGWGEFSPFWEYGDEESYAWWLCAQEAANEGWPEPVRSEIPVNVTVPAVGPERALEIVLASNGCLTAKVKVAEPGQSADEERDRLAAVREALGPRGRIRIDANGAWDVETAVERLSLLNRAAGGLEYAEQPVATVPELAEVRRRAQVLIAADESIRRASDPMAVVRANAADIVVLKVQPLGGVRACLRLAEEVGLPVVVSSALESSVGIAAGVALAAALPSLPFACGLATVQLFSADAVTHPLVPVAGYLPVVRPDVTADSLGAVLAPEDVASRWRDRVARMERLGRGAQLGDAENRRRHGKVEG